MSSRESGWTAYLQWNARLANRFYSSKAARRLAYLDVSREVLLELAREHNELGDPLAHLTASVASTLDLDRAHHSMFWAHRERLRAWQRAHTRDPPPCIGLLGLLALAAEQMSGDGQLAATNYYGRLARLLSIDERYHEDLQRAFRRDTPALWHALNAWLESWRGERGLPTAFAFDHRRYVGLPISQALLREADRQHLPECFAAYGARGGQRISPADMQRLLSDWIPAAPVSARLKRLWAQEHARERIAEIACLELEAWDGLAPEATAASGTLPLLLAAAVQRTPRLRLDLALAARAGPSTPKGSCRLLIHLEQAGPAIAQIPAQLMPTSFADYYLLRAQCAIAYDRALISHLRIDATSDSARPLERRWKQVVVLRHEPESHLYMETKRVELGEDHIALVHESIEPQARDYLMSVATSDLRRVTSLDNASVPTQWTAFLDARITGTRTTDKEELQALVPVATTNVLLDGGLRLPGRAIWHVSHPPQVTVVSLSSNKHIVSVWQPSEQELAEGGGERVLGETQRGDAWPLQALGLKDGEYRVLVKDAKLPAEAPAVATARFRLCSAQTPRHEMDIPLGHRPDCPLWPLTASEIREDYEGPLLLGAQLQHWPQAELRNDAVAALPPAARTGRTEDDPPLEQPDDSAAAPGHAIPQTGSAAAPPLCARRGCHYWLLPPADRDSPRRQDLLGRCRDCGLERWFRPRQSWHRRGRGAAQFQDRSARAIELPLRIAEADISPDDLLDALTHLQSGDERELITLLEGHEAQAVAQMEVLRLMASLGHLDFALTQDGSHVARWRIAPPTLVQISPSEAFLAGARSMPLLERLSEAVTALGGLFVEDAQPSAPKRIRATGLDRPALLSVARSCSEALSVSMMTVHDAGLALARRLPPLCSLSSALRRDRWPELSAERFDVATLTWRIVDRPTSPGAYRFGQSPRQYGFIDELALQRREMARADYRTVKHLAAILAQQPLLAYSPAAGAMQLPLGAELPYLYERALVLASGLAPIKRTDGVVHYRDISSMLAREIGSRMSAAGVTRPKEKLCI